MADLGILISTFDGSADLWEPLNEAYARYWPDNPYKVYLSTNHLDCHLGGMVALQVGDERSWSDNVFKSLSLISEEHVLLTFDDLFPMARVDTKSIASLFRLQIDNDMSYLGLHPSPKPRESFNGRVGRIREGSLYRASTVWSIWKKDILIALLDRTESAWQFERNASVRSADDPHYYRVYRELIPYENAVIKGLWVPAVRRELLARGFPVDQGARRQMSAVEQFGERARQVRAFLFRSMVPSTWQHRVKSVFSRNDYMLRD